MLYVILGHAYAFMADTFMWENYRENSIGVNGEPGEWERERERTQAFGKVADIAVYGG